MATRPINPAAVVRLSALPLQFPCLSRVRARNLTCDFLLRPQASPRKFSTVSSRRIALLSSQHFTVPPSRSYATDNTPLGTISKGTAGAPAGLQTPEHLDDKERLVFEKLREALEPIKLEVQDISGGCGSMYGIEIVSERFRGLNMLKQQRLVNEVLGEEIKGWHGVQLKTKVPS